ncbi:MAG: glyoxylate/hydroxypyruvate reductase A [Burkholderiales bacterium]|nr:glyoxylate/hydroxypyruvate reductase A [Burkholderiales bacterium]
MNIIFQDNGNHLDEWLQALKQTLPQAKVRIWQEGDDAPADYAIVWKPPVAMLRGRSALKAIFSRGAGVDGILQLGADLPAGVPVLRLSDAGMGVQMAEYVTHAVLRYFRRFDEYQLLERDACWRFLPPRQREDFSIGVLGLGVLGQRIVAALQHFGFPVNGWSRTQKTVDGVTCYAGREQLAAFMQASKVVVCILPLTADTQGILDRVSLGQLPQGAYLINVARGAHLVEDDLLALVQSGQIAGATLDVFAQEPLPRQHPFWREPRITLTPHIAAMTMVGESVAQIAQRIQVLEQGLPVDGVVDIKRGY